MDGLRNEIGGGGTRPTLNVAAALGMISSEDKEKAKATETEAEQNANEAGT